jgi:hypothetical protein
VNWVTVKVGYSVIGIGGGSDKALAHFGVRTGCWDDGIKVNQVGSWLGATGGVTKAVVKC